ncbi:hypothetical protein V1477_008351 [Vespula maculifrons]
MTDPLFSRFVLRAQMRWRRGSSQEIQGVGGWILGVEGWDDSRPYSQKGILLFLPYTRISSTIYLFKPPPIYSWG